MGLNLSDTLDVTEQDVLDFIGEDADSELACLCDTLGPKGVLDLMSIYGGSSVYVPNLDALLRAKRNRLIAKDFQNGVAVSQLARRYGVTTRTIYYVVYGK